MSSDREAVPTMVICYRWMITVAASLFLLWPPQACPTQCPERPWHIVCDWTFSTPSHFSSQPGLPEIILSLVSFWGVYSKPIPEPGSNRKATWPHVQPTSFPSQASLQEKESKNSGQDRWKVCEGAGFLGSGNHKWFPRPGEGVERGDVALEMQALMAEQRVGGAPAHPGPPR